MKPLMKEESFALDPVIPSHINKIVTPVFKRSQTTVKLPASTEIELSAPPIMKHASSIPAKKIAKLVNSSTVSDVNMDMMSD